MQWSTLNSAEDASVNHTLPTGDGGFLESRFVQRTPEYFICYLSSHSGCNHSCRFCHLTATKQTMMTPVTIDEYVEQAEQVLQTYRARLQAGHAPAQRVHFNFMARGEALSNPHFRSQSRHLFQRLRYLAQLEGLECRFLISTIMPRDFDDDLTHVLDDPDASLYYSLYAIDPTFRRRWLPKAMTPRQALFLIRDYQLRTGRDVVLHWAFIKGENDSIGSVRETVDLVQELGVQAKFNLVRYNPHDARHGVEPDEAHLQQLFEFIQSRMHCDGSRIVPRVGYDVKASCGMFIDPRTLPSSPERAETHMTPEEEQARALAVKFHDNYETLAPSFGYATREETRNFNPDTPNGRLMIAVCKKLIEDGAIQVP